MSVKVYDKHADPEHFAPLMHVSKSTAHRWLLDGGWEAIPGYPKAIRKCDRIRHTIVTSSRATPYVGPLPPSEEPGLKFRDTIHSQLSPASRRCLVRMAGHIANRG